MFSRRLWKGILCSLYYPGPRYTTPTWFFLKILISWSHSAPRNMSKHNIMSCKYVSEKTIHEMSEYRIQINLITCEFQRTMF